MIQLNFTSGQILDIIDGLALKSDKALSNDDFQLAHYYDNLIDQFQSVYDKLQDFIPENRVANLVLAAN